MANRKYPWEDWFSEEEFVISRGEDFDCSMRTMDNQIRINAEAYGKSVSIRTDDDNQSLLVKVKERNGK